MIDAMFEEQTDEFEDDVDEQECEAEVTNKGDWKIITINYNNGTLTLRDKFDQPILETGIDEELTRSIVDDMMRKILNLSRISDPTVEEI
jgi:hypothetical protein